MIDNEANKYENHSTGFADIVKGVTPYTFINIYETANKISAIVFDNSKLPVKNVIYSITYDESKAKLLDKTIRINDVIPLKTISDNSGQLVEEMQTNKLKVETVAAQILGVELNQLTQALISSVQSFDSKPVETIKDIAISAGANEESFNEFLKQVNGCANGS